MADPSPLPMTSPLSLELFPPPEDLCEEPELLELLELLEELELLLWEPEELPLLLLCEEELELPELLEELELLELLEELELLEACCC